MIVTILFTMQGSCMSRADRVEVCNVQILPENRKPIHRDAELRNGGRDSFFCHVGHIELLDLDMPETIISLDFLII